MVECPYCNKEMLRINPEHLKHRHNKTMSEMKQEFPRIKIVSEEAQRNIEEACLKKYGVKNVFQLESIKEKAKQTNMKKYNCEYSSQGEESKKKHKITSLSRYGTAHPVKSDVIKNKISTTNLDRYGYNSAMKSPEIQNKVKTTNYNKFYKILLEGMNNLNLELVDDKYVNAHFFHTWRCKKCGIEFKNIWNRIQRGSLCPNCFPNITMYTSKAELEIRKFIKSLGFSIACNDHALIYPFELDIVIPSKKIAIEYCGLYWHCTDYRNEKYHRLIEVEDFLKLPENER